MKSLAIRFLPVYPPLLHAATMWKMNMYIMGVWKTKNFNNNEPMCNASILPFSSIDLFKMVFFRFI